MSALDIDLNDDDLNDPEIIETFNFDVKLVTIRRLFDGITQPYRYNPIGVNNPITDIIRKSQTIRTLVIMGNVFTDVEAIIKMLETNSSIVELKFYADIDNGFCIDTVLAVLPWTSVTHLRLECVGFKKSDSIAQLIQYGSLQHLVILMRYVFSQGHGDLTPITQALSLNTTLKYFHYGTQYESIDLRLFADVLRSNIVLTSMILASKDFRGVEDFAVALEQNMTLLHLGLSGDGQDLNICPIIAAAFRNIFLQRLLVNRFKIKEVKDTDALETNTSLEVLNLRSNSIENVDLLMKSLTKNRYMRVCQLANNPIKDITSIKDMISTNVTLSEMDYLGTEEPVEYINNRLMQNRLNRRNRTCSLYDLFMENYAL